jgi:YidC/Oxa1 family membrane protein insertase
LVTLLTPLIWLEEAILEGLHALGLTWGLTIVALTVLVRTALLPLALRQAEVGRRRAAHAPQLRAIRQRHGDDAAACREELAAYRSEHGLRSRSAVAGLVLQVLVVLSLALLLRGDAADGTFGGAGWLFISDLSEPATGGELALLVGCWIALQLVSLRLAARMGPRRVAIALVAPLPLLFAATQIPAGVLLYLFVSSLFALVQKLALRARARAPMPALATT